MIRSVAIAGGGTAGWMTAAYLQATFGDRIDITVVESPAISTIGVGEATFSTIRHFFSYIGLAERDWMPACNATYKLGIRFRNWRHPGHDFYHPFERPTLIHGYPLQEWWLRLRPSERFDRDCFMISGLCDAMRSPTPSTAGCSTPTTRPCPWGRVRRWPRRTPSIRTRTTSTRPCSRTT